MARCPACLGPTFRTEGGLWYCPVCKESVDPALRERERTDGAVGSSVAGAFQKIFGWVALAIPFIFLVLPQVGCGGVESRSFTGLGLLQMLTGEEGEGIGALVIVAAFILAGACALAGVVGLIGLLSPTAINFSSVGGIGLGSCLFALLAKGDKSLQGVNIQFEVGYYLILIGFIGLLVLSWISSQTGENSS